MIDVKRATQIASDYFAELFSDASFTDVRLEEVEKTEEDGTPYWLITLGYTVADTLDASQEGPLSLSSRLRRPKRQYKIFRIHGETGEVESMKIRTVENA
jgi:predicted transcriptional regulator